MKFGVSTGALEDKGQLEALLAFEPELVEVYNVTSRQLEDALRFRDAHRVELGLHTPVPCDERIESFLPTGPTREGIQRALDHTLRTIETAKTVGALHVVVHYPSPIAEGLSAGLSDIFLPEIARAAAQYKVSVLVENVSPNPDLYSPQHYRALLDRFPELDFCLDVGHAHLLAPTCTVEDFARELGDRIRSCHIYDVHVGRYGAHGHEPLQAGGRSEAGWIDFVGLASILRRSPAVQRLVFEPHPIGAEAWSGAVAGFDWFRRMVRGEE